MPILKDQSELVNGYLMYGVVSYGIWRAACRQAAGHVRVQGNANQSYRVHGVPRSQASEADQTVC